MSVKQYEFRIYGSATSGVEHTIASSNLHADWTPDIQGQVIDVLKGRSQSRPWTVDISDASTFFSAIIATTNGRMALQNRLCDLRANEDGGAFSVIGTGRVGDIFDKVSHYSVSVQDERWLERQYKAFTQQNVPPGTGSSSQYSGSALQPAGLIEDYGVHRPRPVVGRAGLIDSTDGNLALVEISFNEGGPDMADWNEGLQRLIIDDVKTDARPATDAVTGNFVHLRARIDGVDYPVSTFDSVGTSEGSENLLTVGKTIIQSLGTVGGAIGYWVIDVPGNLAADGSVNDAYLYMPTAEPNKLMPLHIGGRDGIPPFLLLRDQYDEAGIVYSSCEMQSLIDDPDFGRGWWRITEPQNLADWAEDHIYGPYGVVPLLNSTGAIVVTKTHLPQGITVSSLFEFTGANLAAQPTWQHSSRDRLTAIVYEYTHEARIFRTPFDGDWAADLIQATSREIERTNDQLDAGTAPRREVRYTLDGIHSQHAFPSGTVTAGHAIWGLDKFVDGMAREKFERFGDGPIKGTLVALSTGTSVNQGDLVRVTLETFPQPQSQARGGNNTRIVQVLSRRDGPIGPIFEWLDVGPSLAPLTTVSVTLAQTVGDEKHSIGATVSGASSGAGYEMQWALGATEPGDTKWLDWALVGDSTAVQIIRPLPSGTIMWGRARATAPSRIRSAWSTAANTTTEVLQAPTALASSSITATSVVLDWSLGTSDSPNYPLEMRGSTGLNASEADLDTFARLPARSTLYKAQGLVENTTHSFDVRHYDEYGGVSTGVSLNVQTIVALPEAPAMRGIGIEIVAGSACA